jgi:hypothetical protein
MERESRRPRGRKCRPRRTPWLPVCALAAACAAPNVDLDTYRAREAEEIADRGEGARDTALAEIEALRREFDLGSARRLALGLAAVHPDDGEVLFVASRGESDALVFLGEAEEERRELAAWSALDFAERAAAAAPESARCRAQLAWALGSTTHLMPMFGRAGHAARTLEVIEEAVALDPAEPRAHATRSVLELRLATLPFMARLFAWGAPDGSREGAVAAGERAVQLRPSREYRAILARARIASEQYEEARTLLAAALESSAGFPRDRELRSTLESLLAEVDAKLGEQP